MGAAATTPADASFDVVVVGAGLAGGLTAAAYLQRTGLRVALVERDAACAPFFRTYERGEGVRFDVAPVNFSPVSPALVDLDLASYGYAIDFPEVLFSTVDGAGRKLTFFADTSRTAAQAARLSPRDAAVLERLLGRLRARARAILAAAVFRPDPDLEEALALTAEAAEVAPQELARLTAPELVEGLFRSEAVRLAVMALPTVNVFGDLLEPGQGALTWLWTFLLRTCRAPAGSSSLPRALERAFLAHGGTLLTEAPARRLLRDPDGACRGVEVEHRGRRLLLRGERAVVSNLGAHLTSELLGVELRPGWRTAGRTVLVADLVLDRSLAWESELLRRSPRVYLVWESWPACVAWLRAAREEREEVFLGHLELTQFDVLYGAGPGGVPLRVRLGTGPYLGEGWRRFEAPLREQVAAVDPAVEVRRLDLVTQLDFWRANPAARHGNPVGGDVVAGQWLGERLPYRTEVPGLYLSSSVWPPGLSWLAPGYNAAWAVAEDLGVRDQPWWRSPPLPDF